MDTTLSQAIITLSRKHLRPIIKSFLKMFENKKYFLYIS